MNLYGMSFKDFVWEANPTTLTVSEERLVKETALPFAGSRTSDLGLKKRRVTGEGYFAGEDCMERWQRLWALFRRGGPGSLRLPGAEPFLALMDGLRLMGVSGKNLVKYSFSFIEHRSGEADGTAGVYRAQAGESLWDYAERSGRDVGLLVSANPDIRDIACLREGEEVRIP